MTREDQHQAQDIKPGFMVLQSNRLENLRQVTVEWLRHHPLAPLENEVILVQSNGIAQWLKLALAEPPQADPPGCGIAAALDVSLPGRFQWQAYRAVVGEGLPETSPFDKALLTWRLLRLLPQMLEEDQVYAPLHHFLSAGDQARKHYQLAKRIADLLDQYQIYRADWLNAWAQGKPAAAGYDGSTALPAADEAWQSALWRRLLADMSPLQREQGRSQVHQRFLKACGGLSGASRPRGLPRRVLVFGLSSLPQQSLEVLAAIAPCCQVILCVHNPCQHYWGDIVDPRQASRWFRQAYRRQPAHPGLPSLPLATEASTASDSAGAANPPPLDDALLNRLFRLGNPLLAAWGKQGRDYLRLLDLHDQRQSYEALFQAQQLAIDLFEAPLETSLLRELQGDIFHLRSLEEARKPTEADHSLGFHIAHSKQREVEILQDHLLGLFSADPSLRPRDVLVMVPDINDFAPHIQAVFGRLESSDARFIPYTLSDQGQAAESPLFHALTQILQLPASRFTLADLQVLLEAPSLRAAFGIDEDELPLLRHWCLGAGIRWGLHGRQRQALGLPAHEQNTWSFGLQRMLLGYAVGQGEAWQGVEPYAEVGGLGASLAGKLSRLLACLDSFWQASQQDAPPLAWAERLGTLLDQCFAPSEDRDAWLLGRFQQILQQWLEACELADFHQPLPLNIVADTLLENLNQQDLSQRFLAGAVNFATLMPMRAIPFRHICLLGMDDASYPRSVSRVDFDLMQADYRPGDRSRREDDRYLFLEALLSARDSLYISWCGRDVRNNTERPASVLVAQLRDYLAQTRGESCLQGLTREYPLQAFSQRYFQAHSQLATYAREWAWQDLPPEGAGPSEMTPSPARASQSREVPAQVSLKDLGDLLRVPAEVFCRQRLGLRFPTLEEQDPDGESFQPGGLERWQLNAALLAAASQALHLDANQDLSTLTTALIQRQQRAGNLPFPPFDELTRASLLPPLEEALGHYQAILAQGWQACAEPVQLQGEQEQSLILMDNIPDLWQQDGGQRQRLVLLGSQIWEKRSTASALKWHYLARQWPAHLAAQLQAPTPSLLLGPDTHFLLHPLNSEQARHLLLSLMDCWQQNLQSPLAAACKASCHFLQARQRQKGDPWQVAENTYQGSFGKSGEVESNPALARLWPDFPALRAAGFEAHSEALYQPLIEHGLDWAERARNNKGGAS